MSERNDAEIKYGEAMQELQTILEGIEGDRFDLDELGPQVERAAWLLKICRQKIDATEMQVKTIIDDLEETREEP